MLMSSLVVSQRLNSRPALRSASSMRWPSSTTARLSGLTCQKLRFHPPAGDVCDLEQCVVLAGQVFEDRLELIELEKAPAHVVLGQHRDIRHGRHHALAQPEP